jgi:hypothetical protein
LVWWPRPVILALQSWIEVSKTPFQQKRKERKIQCAYEIEINNVKEQSVVFLKLSIWYFILEIHNLASLYFFSIEYGNNTIVGLVLLNWNMHACYISFRCINLSNHIHNQLYWIDDSCKCYSIAGHSLSIVHSEEWQL